MERKTENVLASGVVRGVIEGVPADILERLAASVEQDRFVGARTHAVVETLPSGYREAAHVRGSLHVVEVRASSRTLEDVRFALDGARLHYEARCPRMRLTALAHFSMVGVVPIALGLYGYSQKTTMPVLGLAGALVASIVTAWFFAAWFMRDTRSEMRVDVDRIVTAARR